MSRLGTIVKNLKYHVVDSTAQLAESNPIYSVFETTFCGMSNEVSMNARGLALLTCYGGLGFAYSKGRDLWRKVFKINDKTRERVQGIHDALWGMSFNLALAPAFYYVAGSRDLKEIAMGTASAVVIGLLNGPPTGYTVDAYRDLTEMKSCERPSYPKAIKQQPQRIKLEIAALLTAVSFGAMDITYRLNPHPNGTQEVEQTTENLEDLVCE